MDQSLINQKLESLRRCVMRLEDRCPASVEALQSDLDAQDILALNLTRAIQFCVDIASYFLQWTVALPSGRLRRQRFALLIVREKLFLSAVLR